MTKKNDQNNTPSGGGNGITTNGTIIVQQQPVNEQQQQQQQHFVLSAVNNSAPMIITTPLGKISRLIISFRKFLFSCSFYNYSTITNYNNKYSSTTDSNTYDYDSCCFS